ncbi:39S ribosomal protein L30, mitochondrial [Entelurus aequoreus]|uniref:39S ribosomal protein L30, mitochondrial n=1 Tax=Entelurus aequoreus TaxID=161455 RepID=UPI002B1D37DE|nr:39S ribosomal protein L30, mitochondrial [Entelurus aequoreus]
MSILGLKSSPVKILTADALSRCLTFVSARSKFGKARLPKEIFEEQSQEHEKYSGDPNQPHKLHIVTRVKSALRRPYWEKDLIKSFGLQKAQVPVIHKNITSVNNQLKFIKHLIRIEPLKTPHGLPTEQDLADSYINSKGELIIRRLLQPVDTKAIEP